MAEQKQSRAIGELTVNIDVSEGIKNLKKLQKEIRITMQSLKELEKLIDDRQICTKFNGEDYVTNIILKALRNNSVQIKGGI